MMFRNPIFFVAHPGHELRVWGWIEAYKPVTNILTDGGGRHGEPRIAASRRLLKDIGAVPGGIFGELSDADFYHALLAGRRGVFRELLHRLVEALIAEQADAIVGDAYEGFNPAHDVCRTLIDAAAEIAGRTTGREIRNYDFEVTKFESHAGNDCETGDICLSLDDSHLSRKLRSARDFEGLNGEVDQAIATLGVDYFRTEWLRNVAANPRPHSIRSPYYETVGQERVKAGAYDTTIEYVKHVLPILRSIRDQAGLP